MKKYLFMPICRLFCATLLFLLLYSGAALAQSANNLGEIELINRFPLGISFENMQRIANGIGISTPELDSKEKTVITSDKDIMVRFKDTQLEKYVFFFERKKLKVILSAEAFDETQAQSLIDLMLNDALRIWGKPTSVYPDEYGSHALTFVWAEKGSWKEISFFLDERSYVVLQITAQPAKPKKGAYSHRFDAWAKTFMQKTLGQTFPITYLPKDQVVPDRQLGGQFNAVPGDANHLVFITEGDPLQPFRSSKILSLEKNGELLLLIDGKSGGYNFEIKSIAYDARKQQLMVSLNNRLGILDFATKRLDFFSGFRSSAFYDIRSVTWSPRKNRIVISALGPKNGSAIYSLEITESATAKKRFTLSKPRMVVALPDDELPVLSSDGNRIAYFSRGRKSTNKMIGYGPEDPLNTAMYLIDPTKTYGSKNPPPKVMTGLRSVHSASWFLDNQRILLSYEHGIANGITEYYPPEIIDTKAKTRTKLLFPKLKDPTFPDGPTLKPQGVSLTDSGKRIMFSALRWNGQRQDPAQYCLYTCKLDGTELKRLLEHVERKQSEFKYAAEGIAAANVWEDALKRAR